MARKYPEDVPDGIDLWEWYHKVQALPYLFDPENNESIARVALVFRSDIHFRDCDDKTVCIVAWAEKNRVPYRIVVMGETPGGAPHHVYAEIETGLGWLPADATFPDDLAHRPKGEQPSRLGLRQYHEGTAQRFVPKKQVEDRQRTSINKFYFQ